jgi:hypothetical protein
MHPDRQIIPSVAPAVGEWPMKCAVLIFAAGFLACLLVLAAPGLTEMAYVASWMACRVLTSGTCL